ncbi:fructosamine kinase family protein [Mucilaginibacter roseus]|uniref:Fructosamine kinase family protein n=1 Tax=Mucilaginibacter roseus TaxID=1528868 RepID=A0ABS8TYA2_9SPHI|nr:fructosamine kinase family protein [Mucilaginibacter roseus]MCD8739858.1 fructosamine kinase family protein [Mucilaginibacter roseus]
MEALLSAIEQQLNQHITTYQPVSGGDINNAFCLNTSKNIYFLKTNSKHKFPGMFDVETRGLELIRSTQTIAVPHVIMQGDAGDKSYLVLEWIDTKKADAVNTRELGEQLAAMHRVSAESFGLPYDNYIGSLNQSNKQHTTWAEFFVKERLTPLISMAKERDLLNTEDIKLVERLYNKLPELFDEEKPSLIHGDLWGGNYLISGRGKPYLIDPAASYGHREFDIAMTTLFGGFNKEFYGAYNNSFPLNKGWQQRLKLWNIYPLLIHLNLFGAMYRQQLLNNLSLYV